MVCSRIVLISKLMNPFLLENPFPFINKALLLILLITLAKVTSPESTPLAKRVRRNNVLEVDASVEAAVQGSAGRLRAVLMTASAMVVGMVPMALGLGDGGAQAAPLGRAVIGGLTAATIATLFVVPAVYVGLMYLTFKSQA